MLQTVRRLIMFFACHCKDTLTLDRLSGMIDDRSSWYKARLLFDDIRRKTLMAEKAKDDLALAQYIFEEACAKTLYNLTRESAPYDPDSPYWIVPNALSLARRLGVGFDEVVKIAIRG